MRRSRVISLSMIILLMTAILFGNDVMIAQAATEETPVLRYFKVGAGDSSIIQYKYDGKNYWILVDAGQASANNDESNPQNVTAFMNKNGITRFEYVIITHYHSDHVGGLAEILGVDMSNATSTPKIKVGTFLARKYSSGTMGRLKLIGDKTKYGEFAQTGIDTNYNRFAELCSHYKNATWVFPSDSSNTVFKFKNLTLRFLNKGTTFITDTTLKKYAEMKTDSARRSCPYKPHSLVNNDSLVFTAEYNGKKALYTGDIHQLACNYLMESHASLLSAKYLKVPHHALLDINKSDYLKNFFKKVSPSYSVISTKEFTTNPHLGYINGIADYLTKTIGSKVYRTYLSHGYEIFTLK